MSQSTSRSLKRSMSPCTVRKPLCAEHRFRGERLQPTLIFIRQGLLDRKATLLIRRPPVTSQANLRKARDLPSYFLRLFPGFPLRDDTIGKADLEGFVSVDRSTGQDHIESSTQANQPRQTHRSAIQ